MTHCHNCGHTGTFVLLVQFALAVSAPDADRDSDVSSGPRRGAASAGDPDDSPSAEDADAEDADAADVRPPTGECSLAVQCPACDSTDVGVAAADLLARHGASTTS
ncbi:hypothetical protein [Halorussus sp. AFM4]|uniref:hypothetical protein n=1 Tax=Halorussus sp. AFM4 TaxID=3421651 RepID=UPI003EB8CACE